MVSRKILYPTMLGLEFLGLGKRYWAGVRVIRLGLRVIWKLELELIGWSRAKGTGQELALVSPSLSLAKLLVRGGDEDNLETPIFLDYRIFTDLITIC